MPSNAFTLAGLRRLSGWRLLAVWAMLLQVVFAAEHVSAQAARALPGVAADAGGFLHLCLSDPGAAGPTEQSGDHHKASVANCLLCASAAVGAFADDARPDFDARVARVAVVIRWMMEASVRRSSASYAGSARGPPASFQA